MEQDLYRISVLTEISDLPLARRVRPSQFEGLGNFFLAEIEVLSQCKKARQARIGDPETIVSYTPGGVHARR